MVLKKKKAKKKAIKRKAPRKVTKRKATSKKKAPRKVSVKKPAAGGKKKEAAAIGIITHYFPKVNAAVIKLKAQLSVGDAIKIKGHTTDFTQVISSMQINHVAVNQAKKGEEIGLLVDSRVRQHDLVYKA